MNSPPAAGRDLLRRRDELAAGVVDEDVDLPEALERLFDERLDLILLTDVRREREAFPPERLDLLRHCGERLGPAPADRDERACVCQLERGSAADPGAAARDEGNATRIRLLIEDRSHGITTASLGRRPSRTSRTASAGTPVDLALGLLAVPGGMRGEDKPRRVGEACGRLLGQDVEGRTAEPPGAKGFRRVRSCRRGRRAPY